MSGTENGGDAAGIGARLRELRRAAGLTQDEAAAGRFTKQYVSQIERGATVPSEEALDWIAARLGVEPGQLRTGLSAAEIARLERELERGACRLDGHDYPEALEVFAPIRRSLPPAAPRALHRAAVRGEVWSLVRLGSVTEAAEVLAEAPAVTAGEQAEVAYLTAVCCYTISEIDAAQVEFAKALELLDSSEEPDDRLRLDIHQWRSRCYRRQRDNEAAHEDIDRALELCEATGDLRRSAEVHFQASLIAYRLGRWVLSRRYAEVARDLYEQLGDAVTKARVLNNLADFNHLLGNEDVAMAQLHEALAIFEDAGLDAEAGYVLSSLAEICRERGQTVEAEAAARQALALLEGRADHVQEVGMAQLTLARVQLEHGSLDQAESLLDEVDASFQQADSVSHLARSWMTRGELELLRSNDVKAARLYREAAVALQPPDLELDP